MKVIRKILIRLYCIFVVILFMFLIVMPIEMLFAVLKPLVFVLDAIIKMFRTKKIIAEQNGMKFSMKETLKQVREHIIHLADDWDFQSIYDQ